jgi:hypothetical protein
VQERLRRAKDSPLFSYALITVCDFIGLVLCYNGIVEWKAGVVFDLTAASSILKRLFALKDFIEAFEHPPQSAVDYCIGVSGLLWWLTLAQSLLSVKNYRRSVRDYIFLARNYVVVGMDKQARAALDSADATDKETCEVKGLVYAALGDFEKAAMSIKRYLAQAIDVPQPPNDNYIYSALYGGMAVLRGSPEMLCRYIEYGNGHGLSDILLSSIALEMGNIGINPQPIARFLEQQNLIERFPLAYFALMWQADEERDVLDQFDRHEAIEPDARRAMWLCLSALLWPARRRSDAETQQFLEQWLERGLPEIRQIAVGLNDELEKCVLANVLPRVRDYWSKRMSNDLGSVPPVVAAIDASIRPDEVVRKIRPEQTPQEKLPEPPAMSPAPALLAAT